MARFNRDIYDQEPKHKHESMSTDTDSLFRLHDSHDAVLQNKEFDRIGMG